MPSSWISKVMALFLGPPLALVLKINVVPVNIEREYEDHQSIYIHTREEEELGDKATRSCHR